MQYVDESYFEIYTHIRNEDITQSLLRPFCDFKREYRFLWNRLYNMGVVLEVIYIFHCWNSKLDVYLPIELPGQGLTATFPGSVFGHKMFLFFSFLQNGNLIELAVWVFVIKELSVLSEVLEAIFTDDVIGSIEVVVSARKEQINSTAKFWHVIFRNAFTIVSSISIYLH